MIAKLPATWLDMPLKPFNQMLILTWSTNMHIKKCLSTTSLSEISKFNIHLFCFSLF